MERWLETQKRSHNSYMTRLEGQPVFQSELSLGYWWRSDLLATCAIEENIKRARWVFFLFGSVGTFQGDLSPTLISLYYWKLVFGPSKNRQMRKSDLHVAPPTSTA